ncbi:radical SAM protein [bacterium]|nr:MAG: radical SAM protein [bacterium]
MKHLISYLKLRGFKFAFNLFYYHFFWCGRHPLLTKLIYWLNPYPPYIEVEVTTRCNMKCIICEHTYWQEPQRDMTFEEFKYILDQFPRLRWIGLTGIGESFLNKDFIKMLAYAKSKSLLVEIYDNFSLIDQKTADELIRLKIDSVYASIDAATKDTYEKIRAGGDFGRVIDNVRYFIKAKKLNGAPLTAFNFHYIVSKVNLHEMLPYLELVHALSKGDNVTVQFTRLLHSYKEIGDLFVEIPQDLISKVENKARESAITLSWNANTRGQKPTAKNCIEWTMPFIFVTGDVIPCCAGNEANQRNFQKVNSLGNIFEKNFRKIWRGEKYKELRDNLYQGRFPAACKDCCLYRES